MGLRGPPKQFTRYKQVDLTELQFTYLQTVAGNESVAAVVRALIREDLRRRLAREVASVTASKRAKHPGKAPARATDQE
jgi:hypothetical protein